MMTAALAAGFLATSCATSPTTVGDSPGTNLEVDGVKIRYAHLQPPEDPDGWEAGDDVPLYVWLHNSSGEPRTLVGASSPVASRVTLSEGTLPVDLPRMEWLQLERGKPHLVLHDIEEQVRGAEFVTVTLTFASGREAVMRVEAVDPQPDPPASPS
jgi:copper(I)-binding protein